MSEATLLAICGHVAINLMHCKAPMQVAMGCCRTTCRTTLYVNIITKVMNPVSVITQYHSEAGYSFSFSIIYQANNMNHLYHCTHVM